MAIVREYKFMCSDPGQLLIQDDVEKLGLDRVVVASCSPLMHEPTFRGACERAHLNRYLFQMANIREHCSWVTVDGDAATEKAKVLLAGAVAKARELVELPKKTVPVDQRTLIVGAGIAGIQAALDIADSGREVYLVEKDSSIGGHMAKFDKTFPTLDCAACILTPKMVQVGKHKNIHLLSYAEVEKVTGFVGNFKVTVRREAAVRRRERVHRLRGLHRRVPGRGPLRVRRGDDQAQGHLPQLPAGGPDGVRHRPPEGRRLRRWPAPLSRTCRATSR